MLVCRIVAASAGLSACAVRAKVHISFLGAVDLDLTPVDALPEALDVRVPVVLGSCEALLARFEASSAFARSWADCSSALLRAPSTFGVQLSLLL